MHLDRSRVGEDHILTKGKQLNSKSKQLYWLLGKIAGSSVSNKLLIIYKMIVKVIGTYGIEVRGAASYSKIELIQWYKAKMSGWSWAPRSTHQIKPYKETWYQLPPLPADTWSSVNEELKNITIRCLQSLFAICLLDETKLTEWKDYIPRTFTNQ